MKKSIWFLLVLFCVVLFSSCGMIGAESDLFESDWQRADSRMEQIVSALQQKDEDALKSLFSAKAVEEAAALDDEISELFAFLEGDFVSWERNGLASDRSVEYGKTSMLLRYEIVVHTDQECYSLFVFDYNKDTKDPDNEGIYMIEAYKLDYNKKIEAWQDRMRAGIDIIE